MNGQCRGLDGAEDRYQYSPYGEAWVTQGNGSSGLPLVDNVVRFAGERLNPDSALYYNRARWMDTGVGRFAGIDPNPGALMRPISLHDYAYSALDPVNRLDPSGRFSMGDVMGGISGAINISTRAVSFYDTFISPFTEDENSETPTLWDAIMNMVIGGGSGLANAAFGGVGAVAGMAGRSGYANHHLIPVYLCGKDQRSNLATVRSATHGQMHGNLDQMTIAIDLAGKAVTLMLSRGKAKKNLPSLQRYLKKPGGRGAVAGALHVFYEYFGFMDLPNYNSNGRTFGMAFIAEAGRYVESKANTSLPTCHK